MICRTLTYGSTVVLWLLFVANVHANNIYRVGEVIEGKAYNEVWKRWIETDFSIWVGIEGGYEKIVFETETGLGKAQVILSYDDFLHEKLTSLFAKALEWSDVAKKNNADTTKALGCVVGGFDYRDQCERFGITNGKNQMGLQFFAANGGQQTSLVIEIVDKFNEFYKSTLYFDQSGMAKLLLNMDQIEEALEKARETEEKQELFQ